MIHTLKSLIPVIAKRGFFVVALVGLISTASTPTMAQQEKNSTKKVRVKPTEFSARCGSAIQWRGSIEEAMKEAAETGKPVFWYVPTLRGSFMDRKTEIDRYMMAGPFSWPAVIALVNDYFIPIKENASGQLARKLELLPYKFVEPGYIVLDKNGERVTAVDQITTFNPQWIEKLIASSIELETPEQANVNDPARESLDKAWSEFRAGNFAFEDSMIEATHESAAEKILLQGMFAFRRGDQDLARKIWVTAADAQPDHPLAWKAVAEAENWGPFARGFEVHGNLPVQALMAGQNSRGSAAPKDLYDSAKIRERSTEYLLGMQAKNGGWFDSDYDFGGNDSLPNVHVAVTALAGIALIDALEYLPGRREAILDAIRRAADFVNEPSHINPVDRDEILWANAYRVRFLSRLVSFSDQDRVRYSEGLNRAVDDLQSIQTNTGSWYHEYANPFVTATALTALQIGKQNGAIVDEAIIAKGVSALSNERYANGAYPYSGQGTPHKPEEVGGEGKIPESAGRMPLCELALWQCSASSDERLQTALAASFENHKFLAVAYKYDNHTSTMAYGGFFFWYDMQGRAEALSFLSDSEKRNELAQQHRDLVMHLPEFDGCFVDSHELGRCYGTAMALQTLAILDRIQKGQRTR